MLEDEVMAEDRAREQMLRFSTAEQQEPEQILVAVFVNLGGGIADDTGEDDDAIASARRASIQRVSPHGITSPSTLPCPRSLCDVFARHAPGVRAAVRRG